MIDFLMEWQSRMIRRTPWLIPFQIIAGLAVWCGIPLAGAYHRELGMWWGWSTLAILTFYGAVFAAMVYAWITGGREE